MHRHDAGCFVHTYPLFRSVWRLLIMFFCAIRWLYVHLYTLVYMFMHESWLLVCHPCFNIMMLWTSDPNLHLPLVDTTFCLLSCLFILCLHPICYFHCYLSFLFCALLLLSMRLSLSIARLLVSCLYLCMYTYGARTHGVRAWFPRHKKKGCRCKLANMSRVAVFSRFRV